MSEVLLSGIYIKTLKRLKDGSRIILLQDKRKDSDRSDNINVVLSKDMYSDIDPKKDETHLFIIGYLTANPLSDTHIFKNVVATDVQIDNSIIEHDKNEVTVTRGTVANDPVIRYTNKGLSLMDFKVENDGVIIPCVAFGPCVKQFNWISKGTEIFLTGRIQVRKYFSCKRQQYEHTTEVTIVNISVIDEKDKKVLGEA